MRVVRYGVPLLLLVCLAAGCGDRGSHATGSAPRLDDDPDTETAASATADPRTDAVTLGRALELVRVPNGRPVAAPTDPRLLHITPTQGAEPTRQVVRWWSVAAPPEEALRSVVTRLPGAVCAHPAGNGRLTGPDLLVASAWYIRLPGQAPETLLTVGAGRTTGMRRTLLYAAATAYPAPVHPFRVPRPVRRVSVSAEHLDVLPGQYTGAAARAFARAVDDLTTPTPGPRSCPTPEVGAPPSRLTLELDTPSGPVRVVVRGDGCMFATISRGGRVIAVDLDGGWTLLDLARRLGRAPAAAQADMPGRDGAAR